MSKLQIDRLIGEDCFFISSPFHDSLCFFDIKINDKIPIEDFSVGIVGVATNFVVINKGRIKFNAHFISHLNLDYFNLNNFDYTYKVESCENGKKIFRLMSILHRRIT